MWIHILFPHNVISHFAPAFNIPNAEAQRSACQIGWADFDTHLTAFYDSNFFCALSARCPRRPSRAPRAPAVFAL
eukprot:8440666-Pyramimonas_sp.AAC.1